MTDAPQRFHTLRGFACAEARREERRKTLDPGGARLPLGADAIIG
jgi:hypothetical protein